VRPAIVLSNDRYNKKFADFVAIPLTTNLQLKDYSIIVTNEELETGKLMKNSRANR
jgi:mRNA-degrading endonuclease toxin of MazEF toxin-antitoxin module